MKINFLAYLIPLILICILGGPNLSQTQDLARLGAVGMGGGVSAAGVDPCTGANPDDCTVRETFDGITSCYAEDANNNCK